MKRRDICKNTILVGFLVAMLITTVILPVLGSYVSNVTNEDPELPPAYRLHHQFQRNSTAYFGDNQTMHEYPENESIFRTVAVCNMSDGEYRYSEGINGENIRPQCSNSRYMFGSGSRGGIYRTQDGETWERVSTGYTTYIFALSDDTLIRIGRYPIDAYWRQKIYRSTDDGVTWHIPKWANDTGKNFALLCPGANIRATGLHQAESGTIIMVEYKLYAYINDTGSARYIYRSNDSGATWQVVHDVGLGNITHFHGVGKHEGLNRWIASTGDSGINPPQGIGFNLLPVSDDDGQTWYYYLQPGTERRIQPLDFLDYGHPTRILFGSDAGYQVGWMDISDGPNAKQIHSVLTNWNPFYHKNYCWKLFKHNDVYYACNYDMTYDENSQPVISVSSDLEHWAVYHRLNQGEFGAIKFAGEAGGKLHLYVHGGDDYRHLAISPTEVTTTEGLVLSPATENLFNSTASSAESTEGWINVAGGGILEYTTDIAHHGQGCLHYFRNDGNYGELWSPSIPCEAGKTYQAQFRVRWLAFDLAISWIYDDIEDSTFFCAPASQDQWLEMITPPFTAPYGCDARIRFWTWPNLGDDTFELYIDSLQIEEVPRTPWQLGGTPREATHIDSIFRYYDAWTNIFHVVPDTISDHLAQAGNLTLRQYWFDSDTYAELYFDTNDSRFKLQTIVDGVEDILLATSYQRFWREANICLVVQCSEDQLSLSIGNGKPIETVNSTWPGSPISPGSGPSILTIHSGSTDEMKSLPCTFFYDVMYQAYLSDEQLLSVMNDIDSGICLGDMNTDGTIDYFDIDPFILALMDPVEYENLYSVDPDVVGDINQDGVLNAFDIDPFVQILFGG